ncbi:LOW QUALITY PROTEIN: uncharacterized protein, partial [Diabrotica undecimpunctata]|uniref:LOW QUALITY PROTEIN: uncharacterized protein n=1 Tax=Diabrotica undecimpunctata TaxID=50387 RepID=UPI003B638C4D
AVNLGTIAKSGTAEFLSKMQNADSSQDMNDMIGQFGVGFYSAFLVADRVIVTSKHNDDKQYIWESDSASFSIVDDPRGDSLKRGTTVSLELKSEARDFLDHDNIRNLVKKYSQFINFPIYLWTSHTETVEEPLDDDASEETSPSADEDDAAVEEEKEEDKPKTKKVEKTVWDWELLNDSKPIWTRKPTEVEDAEYNEFYQALTKDTKDPLTKIHFVAEGEVTFKALLYVPNVQLYNESFNRYGTKTDNIKLYVRRVFITDEFNDMMPSYLSFVRGIVDSDDLPLNVSRETLQHKLIKVIKKKLIRKVLDMLKKLPDDEYDKFWKEFSTNIKLGAIEDPSNRTRLAKLLKFLSSNGSGLTNLSDYVKRMKPKQDKIFYIAGSSKDEVSKSPFVERLLRKGYEVLFLVEAVGEYAISAIPEFEGKKFQNVAKEGFSLTEAEGGKEQLEQLKKTFEPLTKWLADDALKNDIAKATVSERLSDSPCALVASLFGWTGNMERLALSNAHQKSDDPQRTYYLNQKKTLEINPRHPLMKELLKRVLDDSSDPTAKNMAVMMFRTATLRSGYMLQETADFAESIEAMMRKTLGVPLDEQIEEEEDLPEDGISEEDQIDADSDSKDEDHDELGNWYAATLHCKSFNMDLVSIESKEENDFLFQSMKSVLGKSERWTRLWTSGTSLPYNKWVWMATGNPVVYTNWYPGEPNNQTHQEFAAVNLGTIAKSGTAEFLSKMQNADSSQDMNDMIGQFGVGFYSAFLVADRVIVTSKHNDDKQYIWESDSASFSIVDDPRGDSLKRGTTVSLELKSEARDFLDHDNIRNLVKKYSQFINFPIYLWTSHTETVEEPLDDDASEETSPSADEDDAAVEEEKEEDKPKTKKVEKTVWDWELLNDSKPIWTRKPTEVEDAEYNEFYQALTKDTKDPLTKIHFVAEGEVTFKALLYVPNVQPSESFNRYGTKTDNIKLYVRRVFITDEFNDMMPSYLSFVRGIVDSDDLPLNVSRETLQHKLIKVIKKKLIRKVLDMLKKLPDDEYDKFWKEFSTNIKLGAIEDPSNRTRLAKLLKFLSSNGSGLTNLSDYVKRMKPKQDKIFYIAGSSKDEVSKSPFVERLLRKGYEVLFLVEAVDEYAISAIPEFEGKKFQNIAKEGFSLTEAEGGKEQLEQLKKTFEPLTKWLADDALKNDIAKATVSERLSDSPCALVASLFGWTGNMERLALSNAHQKSDDPQRTYYLNQKKTLEINPRHPLMKELLKRVLDDSSDPTAKNMAVMMFRTATLRSGYMLQETADFAESIEAMMRKTLGVPLDEQIEEEEDLPEDGISEEDQIDADSDSKDEDHDEL